MYTFLVLGLIPGTNIQISFWAWIIIMVLVTLGAYRLRHRVTAYASKWWHQFDTSDITRQPLHASQLHLRGL